MTTVLVQDQILQPGVKVRSPSGSYELVLDPSGKLTVTSTSDQKVAWQVNSGASGLQAPPRLALQSDFNLVLYDAKNRAFWASTNYPVSGVTYPVKLVLADSGVLTLSDGDNRYLWSSVPPPLGSTPVTGKLSSGSACPTLASVPGVAGSGGTCAYPIEIFELPSAVAAWTAAFPSQDNAVATARVMTRACSKKSPLSSACAAPCAVTLAAGEQTPCSDAWSSHCAEGDNIGAAECRNFCGLIRSDACSRAAADFCRQNSLDPWCACVLSTVPLAECYDQTCVNSKGAYLSATMAANRSKGCSTPDSCQQFRDLKGDVTSDLAKQQCAAVWSAPTATTSNSSSTSGSASTTGGSSSSTPSSSSSGSSSGSSTATPPPPVAGSGSVSSSPGTGTSLSTSEFGVPIWGWLLLALAALVILGLLLRR